VKVAKLVLAPAIWGFDPQPSLPSSVLWRRGGGVLSGRAVRFCEGPERTYGMVPWWTYAKGAVYFRGGNLVIKSLLL
jgi:hypothetical protein